METESAAVPPALVKQTETIASQGTPARHTDGVSACCFQASVGRISWDGVQLPWGAFPDHKQMPYSCRQCFKEPTKGPACSLTLIFH